MFFSLDPGGLRAFEPAPEVIKSPDLDLGELFASSATDLLGERAIALTNRRLSETGDQETDGDANPDGADPDAANGDEHTNLAAGPTGTTLLTERGSLIVLGYASHVEANHLVGWLATAAGLHGVAASMLDETLGAELDLAAAHADLVGHDVPERFVDLPRLIVIGQTFEADVRATLDILRASGAAIDVRAMTVLSTNGDERILTIEPVGEQGQSGTRRPPRRVAPPASARAKAPVIDLADIADLGADRPPTSETASAGSRPPGPPPPAPS